MKKRCLIGVLALSSCLTVLAADRARPNIVVLVADDWGFSDVGAFGGEIATPNLDALAYQGMRFANFHVAASCAPTRSMLLTGVDNHRNGVGNLTETMPQSHLGKPGYLGSLNQRVVTVATLLKDSGYRTYIAGKWNVGTEPHNRPDQRGFERSLVQGDTGSDNWDPQQRYLPHTDRVQWFEDGKQAVMPATYYSSEFFVDKTLAYLRSGAGSNKPFFAYVGFQANHVPLQAPRAFIDKYQGRYRQGWTALRQARRDKAAELGLIPKGTPMATMYSTESWDARSASDKQYQERRMEVYAAMAEAMDHHVGRLVAHLKQSGDFENTVFVFLSDNGPEGSDYSDAQPWLWTQYTQAIDKLGDKGAYAIMGPSWASAAAAPLNGYKFYSGEGGIRTPMFISGVPGAQPNQIQRSFTHVTDIAPTLLELAQVARPGSSYLGQPVELMRGRSLLPALTGAAQQVHPVDEPIGYELSGNLALFKGELKLVKNMAPVGDGQWHLFNLQKDPGETLDLQGQMPDVFRAMQADYDNYARTHGVLPMPDGYSPSQQVLINSVVNYWWPFYGKPIVLWSALLAFGAASLIILRRRGRQSTR